MKLKITTCNYADNVEYDKAGNGTVSNGYGGWSGWLVGVGWLKMERLQLRYLRLIGIKWKETRLMIRSVEDGVLE